METLNNNQLIKLVTVSITALLATSICFYLMFFLIANETSVTTEPETISYVVPSLKEHEPVVPVTTRKKPQKLLPLEPPPDPDAIQINQTSWVEVQAEKPTFGSMADLLGPNDTQLELEARHSELIPLFVVQPIYPLSAVMREIDGFVIVKFSVRENGTVANPTIVQSEPEVLCDDAALSAASRFKFKPREVGGEKIRADHVQMKFSFRLDSLYDMPEEYKP